MYFSFITSSSGLKKYQVSIPPQSPFNRTFLSFTVTTPTKLILWPIPTKLYSGGNRKGGNFPDREVSKAHCVSLKSIFSISAKEKDVPLKATKKLSLQLYTSQ